jgi:hypothetical protein
MSPISHDDNSSAIKSNGYPDATNGVALNGNSGSPNGSGYVNGYFTNGNGVTPSELEPMAIIGMACQFPQDAENPEKFWKLLLEGRSAMTEFPKEKLNIDSHYHPDSAHGSSVGRTPF